MHGAKTLIRRLLVVAGVILAYRVGASVAAPGIDAAALAASAQNQRFGLSTLFSGGALTRGSIFALGITPFITASIAVTMLEGIIPTLKALKDDGVMGQKKKNRIIRMIALIIVAVQAPLHAVAISKSNAQVLHGFVGIALTSFAFIVGYFICLWFAETVTRRGVGNGVTTLMLASITASAGTALNTLAKMSGPVAVLKVSGAILFVVAWTVFAHMTTRPMDVASSRIQVLNEPKPATLAFKLMIVGVIPIIFASSLTSAFVQVAVKITGNTHLHSYSNDRTWLGALLLIVFAVGLCRVYTRVTFDPVEVTNNVYKGSKFVLGVLPGWPTAQLFHRVTASLAWLSCIVFAPIIIAAPIATQILGFPAPMIVGVSGAMAAAALVETSKQAKGILRLDREESVRDEMSLARKLAGAQ